MDIKALKTLRAIAETGSFQAAANQLNYAQSTVTFQVQQLERELALQLFEKVGRKMVFTQAGKDLLPAIDNILGTVTAMKNYGKATAAFTGDLRIAIPDTLLTYRMQPFLKAFHAAAPAVQLSLQMANCFAIPQRVTNGTVDVGVHYDVGSYGPNLVVGRLRDFPLVLVASGQRDPATVNLQVSHQRLDCALITDDRESIYHKRFSAAIAERDISFPHFLEIGSVEAVKQSVISNLGVAYLPKFVVQPELDTGQLQVLPTAFAHETLTAVYVYRKNKEQSSLFTEFIQSLVTAFTDKNKSKNSSGFGYD
ncbi:LysR family transcriptional regulator [Lactiplantibacillus sp. WILCCON 0030]|uniref:LysR family transcriptional regulator n=1 Tax=Lactiplantibacillus brownii TaxID=3069269 RepID=A0ABU1A6V9_9LACO|nr:LysR family transcriptional regulator [Lactiplantibacillus brownii]MDQ7936187.1 LysR family transcriptional regulator [Lactiplantibacillus brownii]